MIHNPAFREGLPADPELAGTAEAVLEAVWRHRPPEALALGIHELDPGWPSFTGPGLTGFAHTLAALERRLGPEPGPDDPDLWADWVTLHDLIAAERDEVEVQRTFARDPGFYNALIAGTLLAETRRMRASGAARVAAYLEDVPRLLDEARRQLDNPPALLVELARRQFADTLPWIRDELPGVWAGAPAPDRARGEAAATRAVEAYRRFLDFLERDLAPRARGPLAWGAERLSRRLWVSERITTSLEDLAAAGEAELARLEERLRRAAAALVQDGDVEAARALLASDHPGTPGLAAAAAATLDELAAFCRRRDLVTLPEGPGPVVVETPGYLRAVTMASIDPPGPFEAEAVPAYYQVTPPDPAWDRATAAAYLGSFNPWALRIISAHEVYPGHFVQFAHLRHGSSVRRAAWSLAFVEGWAHYTEELLLEEGLGDGDPRLELAWALEALERVGRLLVAVHLHAGDWTPEEAEDFFRRRCRLTPPAARRETWRGAQDPLYLVYTWGKLEFRRLREQVRRDRGPAFSLRGFHDAALGQGAPALPVLERLLKPPVRAPEKGG